MKCPKCDDQEMSQSTHQGIEVDRCPACQGIWLDRGEVMKILSQQLADQIDHGDAEGIDEEKDAAPATCRSCDQPMAALTGQSGVRFDYCRKCRTMFLDAGELKALQQAKG